jgi:hypothetical protein
MEVPQRNFTVESFHAWLKEKAKDYSRRLKLVCLFSTFSDWEDPSQVLSLKRLLERRGFTVKAMGEIRELSTSYVEPVTDRTVQVKFYCHVSRDTQILRCFTTARGADVKKTLSPVTEQPGLYDLWINPVAFDEIKKVILSRPGARVTRFVARRVSSMSLDARIRPEMGRTMIYFGDDAEQTLEESTYQYGVIPDAMRFRVPGVGNLQIGRRGTFSYFGGEMSFLLETSDLAIDRVLRTKRIIDSSRIEVVPLKTASRELELIQFKPWTIELGRPIGAEELGDLFRELEASKFAVYNSIIMKGSLHAESTILDELKLTVFTVMANTHRISVSPRYQSTFESFYRFYQTIVEKFDSRARCTPSAAT